MRIVVIIFVILFMTSAIQNIQHLVQAEDEQAAGSELDQQGSRAEVCINTHIPSLTPSLSGPKDVS